MRSLYMHKETHNMLKKRRKKGKFLIFKQRGHFLEILVAPVCVCVYVWLTMNSFCVSVSSCVRLLVCVCFLMWFCWTEKQAFKFYRENPQIPKWVDNYKQDGTYMWVSMCVCVTGLKPNMFYEFRRQNNYKFLPQLKERVRGKDGDSDSLRFISWHKTNLKRKKHKMDWEEKRQKRQGMKWETGI